MYFKKTPMELKYSILISDLDKSYDLVWDRNPYKFKYTWDELQYEITEHIFLKPIWEKEKIFHTSKFFKCFPNEINSSILHYSFKTYPKSIFDKYKPDIHIFKTVHMEKLLTDTEKLINSLFKEINNYK